MADNQIRFTIGSTFSGEGFKKAQLAVKEVNQEVKMASRAASSVSSALGQLDSSAGKAANAMTSLISAFMAGGPAAAIISVALMALNKYIDDSNKKMAEMKKRSEELHVAVEKAFSKVLSERILEISKEVKSLTDDFDRITKQANQFAAALQGVATAEMDGNIVNLQIEKLNKLLEAHSDAEREAIESTYAMKIAIENSANVETEWALKKDAAHQAIVDNENRVAKIDEQIVKIASERASLEQTMMTAKAAGDSHYLDIQKQVTALIQQEEALEKKKIETEAQTDVLRQNEKRVIQEANNAQTQATIAIRELELADKKAAEAARDRAVKEDVAKQAAAEKAAADAELSLITSQVSASRRNEKKASDNLATEEINQANQAKIAAQAKIDADRAAKELEIAEKNYAAVLRNYNTTENLVADAARALVNSHMPSGLLPVDIQKQIQLTVADERVRQAIEDGTIKTEKEASKYHRDMMREVRYEIAGLQRDQILEAQRYKRLSELNPSAICSSDAAFMARYDAILLADEERKNQVEQAREAVDTQTTKVEETNRKLSSIEDMMKSLGMK